MGERDPCTGVKWNTCLCPGSDSQARRALAVRSPTSGSSTPLIAATAAHTAGVLCVRLLSTTQW
jgi:hypothetical protein